MCCWLLVARDWKESIAAHKKNRDEIDIVVLDIVCLTRAVVRLSLLPIMGVNWMVVHLGPWTTLALVALLFVPTVMTAAVTLKRILR